MFDRETRQSRGFGFVTYEDPMNCRKLLMMGNEGANPDNAMSLVGRLEMQGKVCEIKAATPREGVSPRNRCDDTQRMDNFRRVSTQFDGPHQYVHPMHYGYPSGGMPHGYYYPPPFMVPPGSYVAPHGYMEYPAGPPVPHADPSNSQFAGTPEHGFAFPPVVGIPVMPYSMAMGQHQP